MKGQRNSEISMILPENSYFEQSFSLGTSQCIKKGKEEYLSSPLSSVIPLGSCTENHRIATSRPFYKIFNTFSCCSIAKFSLTLCDPMNFIYLLFSFTPPSLGYFCSEIQVLPLHNIYQFFSDLKKRIQLIYNVALVSDVHQS